MMNGKQFNIAKVAGVLIVLACLVPPWQYTFQAQGISQVVKPAGYNFLFTPPEPERDNVRFGIQVDFGRLGTEILVIIILAGLGFLTAGRDFEDKSDTQKP
jgi:hypothetical protein